MYEKEIKNLLTKRIVFIATAGGNFPRGHVMKAVIDLSGIVWLYHLSQSRIEEISMNSRVVVMADDLNNENTRILIEGEIYEASRVDLECIPKWENICGKSLTYHEKFPSPVYQFKIHTIHYMNSDGIEIILKSRN